LSLPGASGFRELHARITTGVLASVKVTSVNPGENGRL
jgi:hypothetical protein